MPFWMNLMFQDSVSFEMETVTFFHDYSMVLVVFICLVSAYFVCSCFFSVGFDYYIVENHELEFFWTLMPSLILVFLAVPSMKVMYFSEEFYMPVFSFKSTGHQWYWSYEGLESLVDFDSFMDHSLISRLLKTGSIIGVPIGEIVRSLITSADVIHSWSVPSLGVKVDAVPGRLNQVFIMGEFNGLVVGQCSEICGINHSFMPIVLMFS